MKTDRLNEIRKRHERDQIKFDNAEWLADIDVIHQHCAELLDEVDRLRDGIQKYLDGDYPQAERPDKCVHDRYWYEPCITCADAYFSRLLGGES